jgi:hypothetical protein
MKVQPNDIFLTGSRTPARVTLTRPDRPSGNWKATLKITCTYSNTIFKTDGEIKVKQDGNCVITAFCLLFILCFNCCYTRFSSSTGHYSQVAWADTYLVGCGFTAYTADGWNKKLYVCNYGPGGNILGGTMYKVGTACSQCPGACDDGLCV